MAAPAKRAFWRPSMSVAADGTTTRTFIRPGFSPRPSSESVTATVEAEADPKGKRKRSPSPVARVSSRPVIVTMPSEDAAVDENEDEDELKEDSSDANDPKDPEYSESDDEEPAPPTSPRRQPASSRRIPFNGVVIEIPPEAGPSSPRQPCDECTRRGVECVRDRSESKRIKACVACIQLKKRCSVDGVAVNRPHKRRLLPRIESSPSARSPSPASPFPSIITNVTGILADQLKTLQSQAERAAAKLEKLQADLGIGDSLPASSSSSRSEPSASALDATRSTSPGAQISFAELLDKASARTLNVAAFLAVMERRDPGFLAEYMTECEARAGERMGEEV